MSIFKTNFIPATGKYKVHVDNRKSDKWRAHNAARFHISVNNEKHAGDKFYAQCEWAAQRFDKVQLIVSDSLYRYNIQATADVTGMIAYNIAMNIGDKWLHENARAIALLPNFEITRWDQWINHADFKGAHAQVRTCYNSNACFALAVDTVADHFLRKRGDVPCREKYGKLSRAYLLEEIAAFAVMYDADRMIDVRPGSPLKPVLDLLRSGNVAGAPDSFKSMDTVVIDFTRNKGVVKHNAFVKDIAPEKCIPVQAIFI